MHGEPIRILLVEDDAGDARLLREMLHDAGTMATELVWAKSLAEALQCLSTEAYEVILLDLALPDSQGWDTFTSVHSPAPQVPIVVLTGLDDEEVAIRAMGGGGQDYLVKGYVDGQLLMRAIRYAIERQRLAKALEQSRQEQLALKDQFLSHVSHELRSPLTVIHGCVTLLLDGMDGDLSPKQHEFLDICLRNTNQLGMMISDLLEATRAQSSKLTVEPRCLSLLDLIPEILRNLTLTAEAKQISLVADLQGLLPPVHADPYRVRQILTNLIENAIKFTPAKGEVRLHAAVDHDEPAFARVSVRDTGCGISPEGCEHIFERLYQENSTPYASRKGLGLGLYICRELVNAHGGRIWVESQPEQGSTFTFTLPVFSLAEVLAPLLTHPARQSEALVLISVAVACHCAMSSVRRLDVMLQDAWKALERCILHDRDVLLPRLAPVDGGEMFFIIARTNWLGAEAIVDRLREQPEFLPHRQGDHLEVQISTTPLDPAGGANDPPATALVDLAKRIEALVQSAQSQLRLAHG